MGKRKNDRADDDHGSNRDEDFAPVGLDMDVAGQMPEPGNQPRRKVQRDPDDNQNNACRSLTFITTATSFSLKFPATTSRITPALWASF